MQKSNSIKKTFSYILLIVSIAILSDYLIPGKKNTETISKVKTNYERYYNAGGNSHNSYSIQTESRTFDVSELFTKQVSKNEKITYTLSILFNEVNSYQTNASNKSTHSLRAVSGLFIPLFAILVALLTLYSKKDIEILLFVTTVLLIADLVYLII